MTGSGKIINIDAFKNKESGRKSSKNRAKTEGGESKLGLGTFVVLLVLLVSLFSAIMMTPPSGKIETPALGAIAPHNIKAHEDMLIEDTESTEKNRLLARDAVLDVYDFDSKAGDRTETRVVEAFSLMESAYRSFSDQSYTDVLADRDRAEFDGVKEPLSDNPETAEELEKQYTQARQDISGFEKSPEFGKLETQFDKRLGVRLAEKTRKTARYYHYRQRIGDLVISVLEPVYRKGVVADKRQAPTSSSRGISLKLLSTGGDQVIAGLESVYDLAGARKRIAKSVNASVPDSDPALRRLVNTIANGLLQPNITFNQQQTMERKDKAETEAKPVFFQVRAGEMIIREGELVTPIHDAKLQYISRQKGDRGRLRVFIGSLLLCLMILATAALFTKKYYENLFESPKIALLLGLLLITHIGLVWGFSTVFTLFIIHAQGVDLRTFIMVAPLAFGPMIVSIFFTAELTILFSVVVSALTALMFRDFYILPLLTITSGMICAYQVRSYTKRSSVLRVGALVAVAGIGAAFASDMLGTRLTTTIEFSNIPFAFMGGVLSALFVLGATPVVESLFPVVSDIKLLELSNLNHPLLRRMIVEAPGTYQHSMMVGNLAEEACKSIEANALLAKAGALFHDIGKMKKSEYFVENQRGGSNPHDKLSPSMSVLIITNHIKEGLELARQHKLLPQITAMIPEHHGTQIARFFYVKAKQAEDSSRTVVNESDYKYPGPIPSSKESAIVAIADSLEAAARACDEPTPDKLRSLVTEVINDKFVQGQLDDSHLTLRELALIVDKFTKVLQAIHHNRIKYPELKVQETKSVDGDTDYQPGENRKA